jgi:hypothetical protein
LDTDAEASAQKTAVEASAEICFTMKLVKGGVSPEKK